MQVLERTNRNREPLPKLFLLRGFTSQEQTVDAVEYLFELSRSEATARVLEASWSGEALLLESEYRDLMNKKQHLEDIGARARIDRPC